MSEFESTTENTALKATIIARIHAEGGIAFRDFMQMALYEPDLGYYSGARDPIGRDADYVTSPELSPIFGAMIGRQLREMWQHLGSPPDFDVVEVGPGSGVLCRDIVSWAKRTAPEFADTIRYTLIDPHPLAVARLANKIPPQLFATIRSSLRSQITGVILTNELLDAFPVHRVAMRDGRLREVYVTWDGAQFVEEQRDPITALVKYFDWLGVSPAEGTTAEVNLDAGHWMREAASSLTRGFLLTIDYGYESADLYASWRTDGTLLGFYRQNPTTDYYARLGRQDLTAHVDLTAIRRAGEESALATLGLVSQSEFLANLGIGEALATPPDSTNLEEYTARRRAVTELLDPGGLGRIRVLIQAKDVLDTHLRGLHGAD